MNIPKISAETSYNCTFRARRHNQKDDYKKRYTESLTDYFAKGYNRLSSLEDEDFDLSGERDNYDTFELQKQQEEDFDNFDPNFVIRSEYLRNLYDILSKMSEDERIEFIKKHFSK